MNINAQTPCTAFEGSRRIAAGPLAQVAPDVKVAIDRGKNASVLVFNDATGGVIDLDLRGSAQDIIARLDRAPIDGASPAETRPSAGGQNNGMQPASPRPVGRPKLGVVAREVTLLPRHWDWLSRQSGGASVALRKLVEDARRAGPDKDRVRAAQEAAYRFMSAAAGNETGFEEAARALFACDHARFSECTASWPQDVRDYSVKLAAAAFV